MTSVTYILHACSASLMMRIQCHDISMNQSGKSVDELQNGKLVAVFVVVNADLDVLGAFHASLVTLARDKYCLEVTRICGQGPGPLPDKRGVVSDSRACSAISTNGRYASKPCCAVPPNKLHSAVGVALLQRSLHPWTLFEHGAC